MHAHSSIASGKRLIEFLFPPIDDTHRIEFAGVQIPLIVWHNLEASVRNMPLQVRQRSLPIRVHCL